MISRRDLLASAAVILSRAKDPEGPLSLARSGGATLAVASKREEKRLRKPLEWKAHEVARIPHGYQVAVADINGDGRLDILALSSDEPIVEWWENPTWQPRPVTTETRHNISLAPLFRQGYPLQGLALASDFNLDDSEHGGALWLAEPHFASGAEWRLRRIGQIPTSHRLRWADLDGDGRFELLDVPILGHGAKAPDYAVGAPLTWFEPPQGLFTPHAVAAEQSGPWTPHLIDNTLTVIHGIDVLDWDGDGREEFLTASFEGVHLFKAFGKAPGLTWSRTRLASGDQVSRPRRGSSEIGVGRVWGRRYLATIEPWHGEQVVVYLDDTVAGEGLRAGGTSQGNKLWERKVIDPDFHDGHALACADLDGDGNDEIVAGFRGPGTSLYVYYATDASGVKWERQTLDTAMAASGLVIADVNGDGRPDVVAVGGSTANVKWYENLG